MSASPLAVAPHSAAGITYALSNAQIHAQVAVAVELYTIPYYLSALASIIPPGSPNSTDNSTAAYNAVLSVCTEEMLHLQLAANMCLALNGRPNFTAPVYGVAPTFPNGVAILQPDDPATGDDSVLNATIGNILQALPTMLDIEVPTEFEAGRLVPPYKSIGQMYAALRYWAKLASAQAHWSTANQQALFGTQTYPQIIGSYADLSAAIDTICEQGEGQAMSPPPAKPFVPDDFLVPAADQLLGFGSDPTTQAGYSHFGRFVGLQNLNLDSSVLVYSGTAVVDPTAQQNQSLQQNFAALIATLNSLWAGNGGNIWSMTALLGDAQAVWKAGIVPQWTPVAS